MRNFLIISLLFVFACEQAVVPVEPTENQIKQAANQTYMQINEDIRSLADECRQQGAVIVNPLKAMKCASVCSFDPKNCQKLPMLELTDFTKLACAPAVGQAGWICDYRYKVSTESKFLMDMFTNLYGNDTQAQARFFQTETGEWMMVKLK